MVDALAEWEICGAQTVRASSAQMSSHVEIRATIVRECQLEPRKRNCSANLLATRMLDAGWFGLIMSFLEID